MVVDQVVTRVPTKIKMLNFMLSIKLKEVEKDIVLGKMEQIEEDDSAPV